MSFIMVILIISAGLFLLALGSKRRFGVLGLALASGSVLNQLWVGDLTPLVAEAGIELVAPPLESVVATCLILLPAIALLVSGGPVYRSMKARILGGLAFAVLALALLLDPLDSGLVIEGVGQTVYDFMRQNQAIIITIGLVFALLDLIMTKTPKSPKASSKH